MNDMRQLNGYDLKNNSFNVSKFGYKNEYLFMNRFSLKYIRR